MNALIMAGVTVLLFFVAGLTAGWLAWGRRSKARGAEHLAELGRLANEGAKAMRSAEQGAEHVRNGRDKYRERCRELNMKLRQAATERETTIADGLDVARMTAEQAEGEAEYWRRLAQADDGVKCYSYMAADPHAEHPTLRCEECLFWTPKGPADGGPALDTGRVASIAARYWKMRSERDALMVQKAAEVLPDGERDSPT